jgi:hypothetical protein
MANVWRIRDWDEGEVRTMTRGGRGWEAELYVIQRINELPGWSAVDANDLRNNQPGYDALAAHERGRQLRVSTKSIETKKKGYFEVGGVKPLVDVYALVDMTQPYPWPVYLAGAKPVQALIMARHEKFQTDRGRPVGENKYRPKVSIRLLETIGAKERWSLLDEPVPAEWPPLTDDLLDQARADAPRPS